MDRQILIENTINKLKQLPDLKIKEVNDFVEFLSNKIDDKILLEGIQKITNDSKSFAFLNDDEDIYTVDDLKERYK
jgi:hypothetical protein